MNQADLKEYLDFKAEQYECFDFLKLDPISIPHKFIRKEDIEIAAFLVATIAWGNRQSILKTPTKHIGWVSEYGHRLNFNDQGIGKCIESNQEYLLKNNRVKRIK